MESDEESEKYAGEHNAVGNQRGTNNNNKITSNTKAQVIIRYKQTE